MNDPRGDQQRAPPRSLGRYRISFQLATGGMATMYLARSTGAAGFEKLVALKTIHPHLATQSAFVDMFFDEARIASRVTHPNVCSVFDFGEADGTFYLAMEYVHGQTLADLQRLLRSSPADLVSPAWPYLVARMMAEAADGLHAAHEAKDEQDQPLGIVHRDVTPQNLFLGYDGTIRVVDFGVARAAGRLHETQDGAMKGKLAYLAPEQAKRAPLDRRADIWSLGIVMWELLTGKRLFARDTPGATAMAVLADDIPPPSAVRRGIPPELDTVVMRALQRDRDRRPATARLFALDLHRFVARSPEPITTHDLGEWISTRFAEEKAERERLIMESHRADSAPRAIMDSRLAERTEVTPEPRVIADEIAGVASASAPAPMDGGERSTRRPRVVWLAVALGGLALLSVVALSWALGSGEVAAPPPTTAVAPPIAASTVEPPHVAAPAVDPTAIEMDGEPPTPPAADPAPTPVPSPPETPSTVVRDRPRRAEPEATAMGRVTIATPGGWADVYFGGRSIGRAPGAFSLPAGRQTVELRPFGTAPGRRTSVSVRADETTRLVVPLTD